MGIKRHTRIPLLSPSDNGNGGLHLRDKSLESAISNFLRQGIWIDNAEFAPRFYSLMRMSRGDLEAVESCRKFY